LLHIVVWTRYYQKFLCSFEKFSTLCKWC